MVILSNNQDIEDFTIGCCFFGTGGGGPPIFGQRMLLDALNAGKEIKIIDANLIQDEQWIVTPYLMGTSGPETEVQQKAKKAYGLNEIKVSNMPTAATRLLLEQHLPSISLSAVVSYEIGAAATAGAMATAAWLGVPIIDADYVGRSVPEVIQMLPVANDIDLCPIANADAYGNEAIIHASMNRQMTERIGKALASASFGLVGQATLLSQAKKLKPYMLPKTLTNALKVGQIIRKVAGSKSDLNDQLNRLIGSKIIFEGAISTFNGYEQDGYYVGDIFVDGENDFKNSQLKIWFKNENHIAWLDEKVYITSPDLISIIDESNGQPLTNSQLKTGLRIVIFGTPSHAQWRSGKALALLEPRYFGFDFPAKFIE